MSEHRLHLAVECPKLHLERRHYIKVFITCGCVVSSGLLLMIPGLEFHATLIATATNVIWVWT